MSSLHASLPVSLHVQLACVDVCMQSTLVEMLHACIVMQCGDAIVELGRLSVKHLVALKGRAAVVRAFVIQCLSYDSIARSTSLWCVG